MSLTELFQAKAFEMTQPTSRMLYRTDIEMTDLRYYPNSDFSFNGYTFREIRGTLTTDKVGTVNIRCFVQQEKMFKDEVIDFPGSALRATRLREAIFRRGMAQQHHEHVVSEMEDLLEEGLEDLSRIKERSQELGRPENIVIVMMHGKAGKEKPWSLSPRRGFVLGTTQGLVDAILDNGKEKGEKVDRIVLNVCNEPREDLATQVPGVKINYSYGIMGKFREHLVSGYIAGSIGEFDSDTQTFIPIPREVYKLK